MDGRAAERGVGMIAPARQTSQNVADKAALIGVCIAGVDSGAILAIPLGSAPDCNRSGHEVDANGDCAFLLPRPASDLVPGVLCAASLSSSLTPARLEAKIMVRQFWASSGLGRGVSGETPLKPWRNHQSIDFAAFLARFHGFSLSGLASCVRVRVCAYAYMCAREILETLKPFQKIYVNHRFGGFSVVSEWFHSKPGKAAKGKAPGFPSVSNILAAGYWLRGCGRLVQALSSTLMRGRADETFGFSAGGASIELEQRDLGEIRAGGRNGGFPPFSQCRSSRVGRVMLEGCGKAPGNTTFSGLGRKPVRLVSTSPWSTRRAALGSCAAPADRAEAPPVAPFPAPSSPSMLARYRGRIWIGLRPALNPGVGRVLPRTRQRWRGSIGSGLGLDLARGRMASAGRGNDRRGSFPRRLGNASGGTACVN